MEQIAMQLNRRHDEMVFSHAMVDGELKEHLERRIVPGDCLLCEWFGRSTPVKTENAA